MESIQGEIGQIRADNEAQPTVEELAQELDTNPDYQMARALQNTEPGKATASLVARGCKGAGRPEAFCTCFVAKFMSDLGEAGGAAALPIIQDGLSVSETMALMASVDQSRFMQDMQAVQAISMQCE